ncbi:HNH endonuclease domain protein [Mycobacterium phage Cosmo]|uniref:HNH endonuclease domain protein n=1 Tax=Mycobacterium phage Cosmo TaxID=1567467 RepID=A0A0B4ZXS7_9CAUD|nr:HNH endonuclease domain protein [Mycobacterium phage Cosmo]
MPYKNIEDKRARERQRRQLRIQRMMDYLGGRCAVCGTMESLEFDHIRPEAKSFVVTEHFSMRWDKLVLELDKCQLLCSEHHKVKTQAQRHRVEHGGGVAGRHNCPCELCRAKAREYARAQRGCKGTRLRD